MVPLFTLRDPKHYDYFFYEDGDDNHYIQKKKKNGPKSFITTEHEDYIERLIYWDTQIFARNIIKDLTKYFEDFSISKSRLNSYLKNTMQITVKKKNYF